MPWFDEEASDVQVGLFRPVLALMMRGDDDAGVRVRGRVQEADAPALLEREEQLGGLSAALSDVAARRVGLVVLVHGEAGIGKTALVRRFCGEVGGSTRVLWATCDPLFTPRPLGPLFDVARVVDGELRERVEAGGQPHDVARALMDELARPASVLVVEDLHWADEATLDVLRLCARRIDSVPALLVLTYRDDGLHPSHPLRSMLGELPSAVSERHELPRLSETAVAALAQASALDSAELYERTGGNPFYVTEVLAAGGGQIPPTVRDAVLARAAALSGAARDVLEAVAVVPQRTEVWLLEALAQRALDGLDECLESGMLRGEADGVVFRHELARLAIEESLTPHRAIVLHRRALAALAEPAIGSPDIARLAHHADASGDRDAVLRYAPAAAEDAAMVGAHREALHQYGRALRFGGRLTPRRRAELLERLAEEGFLADLREEALAALDEALAIHRGAGDLLRAGDVLRLRARLKSDTGRTAEARIDVREAVEILERLPPGVELARAYAEVSCLALQADEAEETIAWGEKAIALADPLGDTDALAHALNTIGTIELGLGDMAGKDKLELSLELALRTGELRCVAMAYGNLCGALSRLGRYAEMAPYAQEGIEYCEEHGLDAWAKWLVSAHAEIQLALGEWDEAADTATSIIDAPTSPATTLHPALLVRALVRARRGDPDYRTPLERARTIGESVGDLQWLAADAAAIAECVWLEGRQAEIGPATQASFELALHQGAPASVGVLGLWRWRAGLLDEPPAAAGEPYSYQIAGEWERAASYWRENGCRYEAALALSDSRDGKALREALDELQALGARPAAAIVARRLRELGERGLPRGPRPRTRANPAGLTARELEVLGLLAEGLRNAQIAERLVLSGKTVDHHVSAVLRKLDVRSRGEATAAAARLGLLRP
jgi:DNA-binding CsgD family transcriptional regulator/tetratricopeptide (TPR) repeat protein